MRYHSIKQFASLCLVGAALACPSISPADTIHSGWDLFGTVDAWFGGVEFQGVPLGTFDFGGTIGVQNTYNTDTIIYRNSTITGSGQVSFSAQVVGLQLRSVNQVNMGAGVGYYYITLQSGQTSYSTGTMDFNTHRFTDQLIDYVDVRYGGLAGPIVFSPVCVLTNTGADWRHTDPLASPVILGVNYKLDGVDTSQDFWTPYVDHFSVDWTQIHIVPEPTQLAVLGLGMVCLALAARRGRK